MLILLAIITRKWKKFRPLTQLHNSFFTIVHFLLLRFFTYILIERVNIEVPQVAPTVQVKAAVLLGSTDLQGKAYLLNMTQDNGESGCVICEERGLLLPKAKATLDVTHTDLQLKRKCY